MDNAIALMSRAEVELLELQAKSANRDRAIALTHLQTAILWLHKGNFNAALIAVAATEGERSPTPDDPQWLDKMRGESPPPPSPFEGEQQTPTV